MKFYCYFFSENIKQEIEEVNQQITDTFVIANKSYSKQVKTRKAIDQLLQEEREEKIMHLNNIEKFDNIVRQTIQNAKKAEKKIHKDMLEEKKERRLAKQRANNTFSRSKHDEPTEKKSRKQTYSRGDLSDDQERLIREKVANLEDEVKKAAAIYSAAQGNSEKVKLSQEKTLATLHTLRHARQQLQLSSRQVQQHTERKISTISTDELEIIMNDKHTVPKIISAWKSNEKNIFGLVKQVQEMNDQILSVSTETRWLNSKTVELQSSSASQDSLKNDMALRRRNDLMEVKDKNTLVLKETNVLKNEIDQLCKFSIEDWGEEHKSNACILHKTWQEFNTRFFPLCSVFLCFLCFFFLLFDRYTGGKHVRINQHDVDKEIQTIYSAAVHIAKNVWCHGTTRH